MTTPRPYILGGCLLWEMNNGRLIFSGGMETWLTPYGFFVIFNRKKTTVNKRRSVETQHAASLHENNHSYID
jgi:hypothetical protein